MCCILVGLVHYFLNTLYISIQLARTHSSFTASNEDYYLFAASRHHTPRERYYQHGGGGGKGYVG